MNGGTADISNVVEGHNVNSNSAHKCAATTVVDEVCQRK